jgi:hypothetical protein
MRSLKAFVVVIVCVLLSGVATTPVVAGSARSAPPSGTTLPAIHGGVWGTYAEFAKDIAAAPALTPTQTAYWQAVAAQHPLDVTVFLGPSGLGGAHGLATSVGFETVAGWLYWWGARVYLSNNDLHNLISDMVAGGIGAALAVLCAPTAVLVIICGALGAGAGYLIGEIIWNVIGYNHGCGTYIDINWSLNWHAWGC